ncbi:MAG TPA: hypothetical protein VFV71_04405 [Burkholderiales bacterium]|nr:hypothetical protein [Burkholderiales bacterium]
MRIRGWLSPALALYWAIFCGAAGWLARDEAAAAYPWMGVLSLCAVLAFETGMLHFVLKPRPGERWQGRNGFVALFAVALLIQAATLLKEGKPPYFYVSALYAIATLAVLALWACALGVKVL